MKCRSSTPLLCLQRFSAKHCARNVSQPLPPALARSSSVVFAAAPLFCSTSPENLRNLQRLRPGHAAIAALFGSRQRFRKTRIQGREVLAAAAPLLCGAANRGYSRLSGGRKAGVAHALVRAASILVSTLSLTAQPPEPFQISVDVHLVVLQATVSSRGARFAPDLAEQNFTVYEDGVRQTLKLFRHEDVPVTAGLIVDHSGSMRRKLPEVVAATRTFVQSSNDRDQMFVVNFNDRVATALTGGSPFLIRPEDLERAILRIPAIGMTKLYDAVYEAQDQARAGSMEKKALIVISDGGDNASAHTLAEILKRAELSAALIYAIGIFDEDDPDRNPDVLRRLARFTGGEAFFPAHLEETVEICRQIAHDIRHQYTLGYVSTNTARTGAFRNIKVVASAPGQGKLVVRTRSGYLPASQ